MKKNTVFLTLSILFISFALFSQNPPETSGVFYYTGNLHIDLEKKLEKIDKKHRDKIKLMYKTAAPVNFTLTVNKNESLFKQDQTLDIDTQTMNISKVYGQKGPFYINTLTKETLREKEVLGDLFLIRNSLDSIYWTLSKETKIINKNICYKATTTRKNATLKGITVETIEAWYDPKINLSHGPIGYGGLPGLIVELKTINYIYTLTKFKLSKKISVSKPNKGTLINQNDFFEIEKNANQAILDNRH